ncbi:polyphosphate polymerase domain-containing protein [Demequina sp. SYSU T00039]|uniref:Polyphosphate polymerase domain-containing protein n=1 Tax=Demequina lignilytica TaxID=3051663 RepID=A0AAW7M2I2_9MICO|nr:MULTISPECIES: polyphosphate polymerase domain-containing protein [unclassified Demequina]MDN4477960.1 polyphosphate polymerase domain-containing protein [Demequina sp. SYSU T00039-1]MDN4487869.1 polyphosphate polymerase domain-containing protein [Demequina sp. SYSU T00039]MDN4490748.1 polyphosphate polymerase domain-containing protein [Demequina sp. SYSU T00068]
MTRGWTSRLGTLPAVSLEQIDSEAGLQTRVDRKYIVDPETWSQVLGSLDGVRVLEIDGARIFRYSSVYYDTPELHSYTAAARKRPSRYKVRTREYLDTGSRAIEVKLRSGKGETVKHRAWLQDDAVAEGPLAGEARAFVASFPSVASAVDHLEPVLRTSYERATLLTPDGRITIDRAVTGTAVDGQAVDFGDRLIVETKSALRAGAVDRALWARGIRPSRVSKYCTTLAALRPELPANRWARTLRRHLPTLDPAIAAGS